MDFELTSFAIGVISSLLASIILFFLGRSYGILERARVRFTLGESIKEFKRKYIDSGRLKPYKESRIPLFYFNDREKGKREDKPIYYFFIEEGFHLEMFKGFLIPGLDYGHGVADDELNLNNVLDEKWNDYLFKISRKIEASRKSGLTVEAKRVIFVDKFALDIFINQPDEIIRLAKIRTDGTLSFDEMDEESSLEQFGRFIIRLVFYTIKIHSANWRDKDTISCFYIDKSEVCSTQYYDFGMYRIDGVDIVYNPIYLKGISKSLVRDQLYIGRSKVQKKQIKVFEKDFDEIWNKCKEIDQKDLKGFRDRASSSNDYKNDYYSGKSGNYYKSKVYHLDDFDLGYYKVITEIFMNKLGLDKIQFDKV